MKVLIVEDEHKVVDYLRSGLTEQGWSSMSRSTARKARISPPNTTTT